MIDLPHKLSELAQMAVEDVRKCENDKLFSVEMDDVFIDFDGLVSGEPCVVCAAGAIMAHRLNALEEQKDSPIMFGAENAKALLAVDRLCVGSVSSALYALGKQRGNYLNRRVVSYAENPEQWHADMTQLIADLRANNL